MLARSAPVAKEARQRNRYANHTGRTTVMRPRLSTRLCAALCFLLPLSAWASQAHVSAWNTLYRLDLATGEAVAVGDGIGFNDVEGLALAPDSTLYGVADGTIGTGSQATDFLIRIDTRSGVGSMVGPLSGLSGQGPNGQLDYGLAFTCDGRLWAASDTTGQLWEVNRGTGEVREVAATGVPLSGLAARGNMLYGIGVQIGFGDASQQALYRIDPGTGQVSPVGSLGVDDTLSSSGADFDADGVLWATLDSQPPDVDRASRLARIDPVTGRAEITASIRGVDQNISVRGMAIVPPRGCQNGGGGRAIAEKIPGPGALALSLLGLGMGALARRPLQRHSRPG